jgi:hypothetical protein
MKIDSIFKKIFFRNLHPKSYLLPLQKQIIFNSNTIRLVKDHINIQEKEVDLHRQIQ